MSQSILVIGGARSGKSEYAESRALLASSNPYYIATAEVFDREMAERIDKHKRRRGDQWQEIQAPIDLVGALNQSDLSAVRLVDCLTMWLNNIIYKKIDWRISVSEIVDYIARQSAPSIFVSTEVGLGIIPSNEASREFCDAVGEMNQQIAQAVDEVQFVIAGLATRLK